MLTEINPRLFSWFIANLVLCIVIYFCFWAGYKGEYGFFVVGLGLIPTFIWAFYFGRRPRLILRDTTITLSLFWHKKELPYSSIAHSSLYKTPRDIAPLVKKIMWFKSCSPHFWYIFPLVMSIALFFTFFIKESFSKSLKIGFYFFLITGSIFLFIYLVQVIAFKLLGKIDFSETDIAITFRPDSFTSFPFSYYKKRAIYYRIKAIFTDISERQYLELLDVLKSKADLNFVDNSLKEPNKRLYTDAQ